MNYMNSTKLFKFFIYSSNLFCLQNLYSANYIHSSIKQVNYWKIGENFKESPAIGWFYITFVIFIFIICMYGYKILIKLFFRRSLKIKKYIDQNICFMYFADIHLMKTAQRKKFIDFEIKDIINEFKIKIKIIKIISEKSLNNIKGLLKKDMEKILKHFIGKNKVEILLFIAGLIILDIKNIIKKTKIKVITIEYKRKILNNILKIGI